MSDERKRRNGIEFSWGINEAISEAETTGYIDSSKSDARTRLKLAMIQAGRETTVRVAGEHWDGDFFRQRDVEISNAEVIEIEAEGNYELTMLGITLTHWLAKLVTVEPHLVPRIVHGLMGFGDDGLSETGFKRMAAALDRLAVALRTMDDTDAMRCKR